MTPRGNLLLNRGSKNRKNKQRGVLKDWAGSTAPAMMSVARGPTSVVYLSASWQGAFEQLTKVFWKRLSSLGL